MRFALIAGAGLPALAVAQTTPNVAPSTQVAVSVSVPTPQGTPRAAVEAGMARSAPTDTMVPGLIRKYFTIGETNFGGMYLFRDRASAQAWFSDAWRAKVVTPYGAPPTVTYFDVPLLVDNSGTK